MKRTARLILPNPVESPFPHGLYAANLGLEPNAKRYRMGECAIIAGSTPGTGWHLSISHPTRYPTWDEIAHARYKLIPDAVVMGMLLPKSFQYVNVHPNCFHLWQIPDTYAEKYA